MQGGVSVSTRLTRRQGCSGVESDQGPRPGEDTERLGERPWTAWMTAACPGLSWSWLAGLWPLLLGQSAKGLPCRTPSTHSSVLLRGLARARPAPS